jgi:hypothetical protein
MNFKRVASAVVGGFLLLHGVSSVWADGPGTSGAEFLKIGVGARAIGMGEAYVAQADDVSSLYWNPAGLALMIERQASFMYNQMYQDLKFQNANIGIPLENGAIGASLSYLSYGDIAGYDTTGASLGNQSAYSGVATVGAAWLGNQWSAGVNAKGIQQKLADVTANSAAFDLGANIIYPRPIIGGTLRLGAAVRNLGSDVKFEEQGDPLPMDMKIGLAAVQMLDRKLNYSLDYTKPRDDSGFISTGLEYWAVPFLALRAGYINSKAEGMGVRAGLGLRIKRISFDYAYAGQGELGMSHRYELSLRFGEPRPILTAEERKILQQAKAAMRQERYEQATLLFDSLIELEPRYKPARRYMKVALGKLEGQQAQMLARQGKIFQPGIEGGARKPALPEMDDLEQLLNLGQTRSAQVGQEPKGGAPVSPASEELR